MVETAYLLDDALEQRESTANQKHIGHTSWQDVWSFTTGAHNVPPSFGEQEPLIRKISREHDEPWAATSDYTVYMPSGVELIPLPIEDMFKQKRWVPYFTKYNMGPETTVIWLDVNVIIGHGVPYLRLSSGHPSRLPSTLEQRLEQLRQLPEGWDSYGASKISQRAIEKAKELLDRTLRPGDLPLPFLCPIADGGVGLEWRTKHGRELLCEISPDGSVSYLLVVPHDGGEKEIEGRVRSLGELDSIVEQLSN